MALGTNELVYLILGIACLLGFGVFILIISGKYIFFAIYERIVPRGSHIFVVNANRYIRHYYKVAKDGIFKINKKIYATNPDKLLSLSDDMASEAIQSLDRKKKRLEKIIGKLLMQKEAVEKQMASVPTNDPKNIKLIDDLKSQWGEIDKKIDTMRERLNNREQRYYMNRRGAYLFIEDDPVPKDLHEWYTTMDSIQIENVILRSQTDDKAARAMEKVVADVVLAKKIIIGALIVLGFIAWFVFQDHSALQQIADHLGVTIQV